MSGLLPGLFCFDYCTFIVSFEIRKCESLNFVFCPRLFCPPADVVQLVGPRPANQRVTSLIPGLGTCLGCGFGPWSGLVPEATN